MSTCKTLIFSAVFILFSTIAHAQNEDAVHVYTPYSFYGIGDMAAPGFSFQRGMGGVGIGLRTNRVINIMNPAALSVHDTLSFMFDFGGEMQNYYLATSSNTTANNSANMHHLSMSFPVWKKLVTAISVMPYSSVGYKITQKETRPEVLAQAGDITYTNQGEGGLTQLMWSLGYSFGRLSVGGQAAYIFGSLDRYSNVTFNTGSGFAHVNSGKVYKVNNFGFGLGVQYVQPLSKDNILTIGATWQFKNNMKTDLLDFAFAEGGSGIDSVRYETNPNARLMVPGQLGIGATFQHRNKWLVGFDYIYRDWTGASFDVPASRKFQAVPEHIFRGGFELTPNRFDIRYPLKRWSYRGGIHYQQTYLQFDNNRVQHFGITFGVGIPVGNYNSSINLSAELGQRGTTNNSMIRERYWKMTLSISLYDLWFIKPQFE